MKTKQKRQKDGKVASGKVKTDLSPGLSTKPMIKMAYRAGKRANQAVIYLPKAYIGQVMKVTLAPPSDKARYSR